MGNLSTLNYRLSPNYWFSCWVHGFVGCMALRTTNGIVLGLVIAGGCAVLGRVDWWLLVALQTACAFGTCCVDIEMSSYGSV